MLDFVGVTDAYQAAEHPSRREYEMRFMGEHQHLLSLVSERGRNLNSLIEGQQAERTKSREQAGRRILRSQYEYKHKFNSFLLAYVLCSCLLLSTAAIISTSKWRDYLQQQDFLRSIA